MPERLGIAGDGQMALVLAAVAAEAGHEVSLWCPLPGQAGPLAASRRSPRLPEIALPASVRVGEEAAVLRESTLLLSAIPAQFARDAWRRLAAIAGPRTPVCTVTKGVEVGSGLRPTQVLTAVLGERDTAVLSGPTIAHELALRRPAVMVAASESGELAARVQGTFTQPWLRIYTSPDPAGVEIAGAAKNVIALAAGMLDGLGLGFNAKSALLARGLAELVRLGVAQGPAPTRSLAWPAWATWRPPASVPRVATGPWARRSARAARSSRPSRPPRAWWRGWRPPGPCTSWPEPAGFPCRSSTRCTACSSRASRPPRRCATS